MEKMVFVVRKAIEADIPKIHEITQVAFKAYAQNIGANIELPALAENYEDIKKDIEAKEVFVALLDEIIIGSVRIEIKEDHTAYLSRFGVDSSYQNNGVGRILMSAVDELMIKLEITNLYLHTASKMLSLVRFYYGRGFYIESTTKDRGYIRALLCKNYECQTPHNSSIDANKDCVII
ncbi:GNAT family N-acetyltransferase [Clostridium sp. DJ247]|uniref:GNAT family N-acetyltransferase n=1 Tax=Clostridium sp. DJ247 TaxID=2726188 RepID=UPI001A9B718C|nr:GNAT family N-acetyltransferase [Clostridium sp. DJ247]